MDIADLLAFTVRNKASDLHLSAGEPPMVRVDGDIRRLDLESLDRKDASDLVYSTMDDNQRASFENDLNIDFSYDIQGLARFRVNAYHQDRGVGCAFRVIPEQIMTLEELQAPTIFREMIKVPRGLFLVTGPTGSGKSTTLAAMIDHLNKTTSGHILTIEDPIEFVHKSHNCLVNQREVHRDTHSFGDALRAARDHARQCGDPQSDP
jgi:twitching motility protein PilT